MTVQINYKNNGSKKASSNYVFFVDEKFNISSLKKHISSHDISYISDLLKNRDKKNQILSFSINSKKIIFLISIKEDSSSSEIESLGAKFYNHINFDKTSNYLINADTLNSKIKNFLGYFLHGLKLKSYEFNIYKTKKNKKVVSVSIIGNKNKTSSKDQHPLNNKN